MIFQKIQSKNRKYRKIGNYANQDYYILNNLN